MEFISIGLIVGGLSAFSAAVFITSREGTAKAASTKKITSPPQALSSSSRQKTTEVKIQPSSHTTTTTPILQTALQPPLSLQATQATKSSTRKTEHAQLPGSSQFVPELDDLLAVHMQTNRNTVVAPSWWREQIQELTAEVHTLQQQAKTVERYIAILQTMAYCLDQLEDLRKERVPALETKSASFVAQHIPLPFDTQRLDFLHPTEKRPALRKYTIKAL